MTKIQKIRIVLVICALVIFSICTYLKYRNPLISLDEALGNIDPNDKAQIMLLFDKPESVYLEKSVRDAIWQYVAFPDHSYNLEQLRQIFNDMDIPTLPTPITPE